MAIVEWSDDFKLGEAEIDREHWGLFALSNDLSDQHAQGAGDASITSTVDAWAAYVDVDFQHEERLMRTVGYPELDSHIELHVALARRTLVSRHRLELGDYLPVLLSMAQII